MGIVFRQSIKSTIATFFGAILGALIIYLSATYIPKQEFGFRSTLTNYAVVGGQILILGVNNMIAVYVHRHDAGDKRTSALLSVGFTLPACFIAIATVCYFIFKRQIIDLFHTEDIPFIKQYFAWLPVFTLLFAYNVMLETYLVSQLRVAITTFVREVFLRFLNIILIVLFGLNFIGYETLIYGTVLVYLTSIAILIFFSLRTEAFRFSLNWNVFEKQERNEIAHFTWYHSLLNVSLILIGMLDALMLATLSPDGLKSIPIYTVSIFLMSFLVIPYRAMLSSTLALLIKAFKEKDNEKVASIFNRTSLNMFIATGAMFLLIICNMRNAVAILPAGYADISAVVAILALGRMVDMITGMNDQALSLSSHYKYSFYISVSLVIMLVAFNWWLIPVYGIFGAAWATTFALIIYNVIKLLVVKAKLDLQPISGKTLLVMAAGGAAFIVGYFLPALENPFADAIYRSLILIAVYGGLLVWLKPSTDLNEYLASVKENKRLF